MPLPYIFTFYSYKGGVGRSLALLNVAYSLVSRGRHVLILDLDLEAPGISGFLERNNELEEKDTTDSPASGDVLDLLVTCVDAVNAGSPPLAKSLPPVSQFMRAVRPEGLTRLRQPSEKSDAWTLLVRTSSEIMQGAWRG